MIFRPDSAALWLRPKGLRPFAFGIGLAINLAAVALIGRAHVESPTPLAAIEVAILPSAATPPEAPTGTEAPPAPPEAMPAEPAPEQKAQPEPAPPPKPAPPKEAAPPPPPEKDLAAERLRAERRKELLREKQEERKKEQQAEEGQQKREQARQKAAQEKAAQAKAALAARREGAENSGPSRAAYGAIVVAELRRLQSIGARRAEGATGVVHVTFTVGPSGRIVSHSAGSGDARLSAAAGAIMAAFHAPPPPGGHFTGSTNFTFSAR